MIRFNKFGIFLLALVGVVCFHSCSDDILDLLPEGEVANVDELGVSGEESRLFGIYSLTRTTQVGEWNRYWFGSIRSDDAAKGSTAGDAAAFGTAYDDFQYALNDFLSQSWWDAHFQIIFACNEVINNTQALEDTTDKDFVIESEARAIRAWMYFELRRDFGEVPIITVTIDVPEDTYAPKSSIAEIDAFIIEDLEYAIQYLPLSWPELPGRATLGFANAQLGKLYLYQQDWTNAYDKLSEVINSGVYNLDPDLANLFENEGDNGPGAVFEIQQLVDGLQRFNNNYFISQGVRGTGVWNLGWGFNVPTQNLLDAFEDGDLRRANTILTSGEDDGGFGSGILPESPPLAQPYWNRKAYTRAARRTEFQANTNLWENIKIIRYADVLLMAAEAANELGMSGEAVGYINQVRSRAGLDNLTVIGQAEVRDAIKQERRIEFALEESRFYDLVRWGDANTVLGPLGYQPRNALYPIPQKAIDESQGVIVQNPDY